MSLPDIEVGHMDTSTGHYVRDGAVSFVYLTVAGVRVRASVHTFGGKPELDLTVDPFWTEDNRVFEIDLIEVRASRSQAVLRLCGGPG
jgi:hypothetical protein